jgi:hypothetical protein
MFSKDRAGSLAIGLPVLIYLMAASFNREQRPKENPGS